MGACCGKPAGNESGKHHRRKRPPRADSKKRQHSRKSTTPAVALPTPAGGSAAHKLTSEQQPHTGLTVLPPAGSILSGEEDFHSCRDDFSVCESPCHSATGSPPGTPGLERRSAGRVQRVSRGQNQAQQQQQQSAVDSSTSPFQAVSRVSPTVANGKAASSAQRQDVGEPSGSGSEEGNSDAYDDSQGDDEGSKGRSNIGCLNLIEALSSKLAPPSPDLDGDRPLAKFKSSRGGVHTTSISSTKPSCGVSLSRRDTNEPEASCSMCYEDGDGRHYNIRGQDYMKTKLKVKSEQSIYELVTADMFTFDQKQNHIAQLLNLPGAAPPTHKMTPTSDVCYPPLLIINIQLPTYAPSIFGGTDGPGWSILWVFKLRDGFDPQQFPNQKALGLYRRLILNGKESDGSPTRDRLKIIPRVVNVDEWAQKGPLSSAEHKLLSNYNEKPVLSRPQHLFILEQNYFEIDLDIHTYSYLARSALMSFMTRLSGVVWETAFVVQGNSQEELPEQVLACGRIYRTDFAKPRPFASFIPDGAANGTANGAKG